MARVLMKGLLVAATCIGKTQSTIHVEMCLNDSGNVIPCDDMSMAEPDPSFDDPKIEEQTLPDFDGGDTHSDHQAPPSKMNAIQNLRNTMWKLIEKKDLEAIQLSSELEAAQSITAELQRLQKLYKFARECSKVEASESNDQNSTGMSSTSEGVPTGETNDSSRAKTLLCAAGGGPTKYEGLAALLGLESSPKFAFAALSFWPLDAILTAGALAAALGFALGTNIRQQLLKSVSVV